MQLYEHRQISPWMLLPLVVVVVAFALFGAANPADAFAKLVALIVVALITLMFCTLTTHVDAQRLSWWFTFGLPGGEIPYSNIADVELTRTSLLEGWGIHWTFGHGWLWNVAGFNAVTITKRDGSKTTLGTDDTQSLYDAIARFRTQAQRA